MTFLADLICIDIDGTLLNDAKEVLPEVKKSREKADMKKEERSRLSPGECPVQCRRSKNSLRQTVLKYATRELL